MRIHKAQTCTRRGFLFLSVTFSSHDWEMSSERGNKINSYYAPKPQKCFVPFAVVNQSHVLPALICTDLSLRRLSVSLHLCYVQQRAPPPTTPRLPGLHTHARLNASPECPDLSHPSFESVCDILVSNCQVWLPHSSPRTAYQYCVTLTTANYHWDGDLGFTAALIQIHFLP